MGGEICYMENFWSQSDPGIDHPGARLDHGRSWDGRKERKKADLSFKIASFFFGGERKSKGLSKLIFFIEIISSGFTEDTLAWPWGGRGTHSL